MVRENPLRVFGTVSHDSPYWSQPCHSLIPPIIQLLREKKLYKSTENTPPDTKLLAIKKWETRIFFTFDISNKDYVFDSGHKREEKQNDLPVLVAYLGKGQKVYEASPGVRNRVNDEMAFLHDANGWKADLPFSEDHTSTSPPEYPNPRSLKRD
ncbi:uncharacterized protein N7484_008172 [Penicillium longicatenatum]|uniref:uncharacterized protein n=1 Tax=Penicillium longicatenatum TaxID=1561947 RepID=UPI002546C94B|nr:uncharacterized protein N7484_008172 [Penicillium longicatenatum]KAJ5640310.1 hypothetical protein N7484_008172 [Penicillium longicatenatum]